MLLVYCIIWLTKPQSKPLTEGMLDYFNIEQYLQTLPTTQGRFVRIRPSPTYGDGRITISQIQVIDMNGNNIALKMPVSATSTYPGSADVSVTVDGYVSSRIGLTTVWTSSYANRSTEYWMIDLGSVQQISQVVYSGQADDVNAQSTNNIPITRQRTQGMICEILDTTNNVVATQTFNGLNLSQTVTFPNSINITPSPTGDAIGLLNPLMIPLNSAQPEVYLVSGSYTKLQSDMTCGLLGATVATQGQLQNAYANGASWCTPAWVANQSTSTYNPGCGTAGIKTTTGVNANTLAAVNCFGIKSANGVSSTVQPFNTNAWSQYVLNTTPIFYGNTAVSVPDVQKLYAYIIKNNPTTLSPTTDFFNTLSTNAPLNFLYEGSITPTATISGMTTNIQIFGSISDAAKAEMSSSIDLCSKLFFGSNNDVDSFINISYSSLKPFIRANTGWKNFCKTEIVQSVSPTIGDYVMNLVPANQTSNTSVCSTPFTTDMLGLLPSPARDYIQIWIYNRTKRILQFKSTLNAITAADITSMGITDPTITATSPIESIKNSVQKMQPTVGGSLLPIDPTNNYIQDKIAQSFYEAMGGSYTMTQIYDIFTIGGTILDIRFDMTKHADISSIQTQIATLKAKYIAIRSSNVSQDILDSAKQDYESALLDFQSTQTANVLPPVLGVVGRFFYTYSTSTQAFSITGFTLDARAVTSFIPELNCGIYTSVGSGEGMLNYIPTIVYTKNIPESLPCRDPTTLRKIMDDYIDLTQAELADTLKTGPASAPEMDTSLGTVHVNQIIGAIQVSPTQCAIKWTETLWDDLSNIPVSLNLTNITRRALFSYTVNVDDWFSNNINIDPSGIIFYSSDTVPACKFDPIAYQKSIAPRLNALNPVTDLAKIQTDFMTNGWNNGIGLVCPKEIPNYIFSPLDYCLAWTDLNNWLNAGGNGPLDSAGAKSHYVSYGNTEGRNIRAQQTITPLDTPLVIQQPLPANNTLDTLDGVCPPMTCEDLSVLYSLAQQYNDDPSKPGSILRITRAYTASPYQCDVEVDINYDVMGVNGAGNPVKKGSFTYDDEYKEIPCIICPPLATSPQIYSGRTLALTVSTNVADCSYSLSDVGPPNSGTTIQSNTPALYKPMEYATQFQEATVPLLMSSVNSIVSAITDTAINATSILTTYRDTTTSAVGNIATLGTNCPIKCNNTTILNAMLAYYKAQVNHTKQINTVIRTGTPNSSTCDITYQEDTLVPSGSSYTVSSSQTAGMRFTLIPDTAAPCTFKVAGMTSILPTAPPSAALDMTQKPSSATCDEVYAINSTSLTQLDAANKCISYGGVLATLQQLTDAQKTGADWCQLGYVVDISGTTYSPSCGNTNNGIITNTIRTTGGANCYGLKPKLGQYPDIIPFSGSSWAQTGFCPNTNINYVNPSKEAFTNYGPPVYVSESTFPLNKQSFGLDRGRNQGGPGLDTLFQEPLRSDYNPTGLLYGPRSKDDDTLLQPGKAGSYKYIRFRPIKTRDPLNPTVEVGKFRFFIGNNEVDLRFAKVSNPMGSWVGNNIHDVVGPGFRRGWSDLHKKALVLAFPYAILMNGFTWTTANPDKGVGGDPVQWKLEGSQNGVYWTILRDQTKHNYPVPLERYQELSIFRF